jgi:hypothetical protein
MVIGQVSSAHAHGVEIICSQEQSRAHRCKGINYRLAEIFLLRTANSQISSISTETRCRAQVLFAGIGIGARSSG